MEVDIFYTFHKRFFWCLGLGEHRLENGVRTAQTATSTMLMGGM